MLVDAGTLDTFVRLERPSAGEGFDAAGDGEWLLVDEIWIGIQDALPSRGERLADGMNITTRPARVRLRYRPDINASMRFVSGGRIMQIVAGPAEIGRRQWLEFMVEDYSVAGNAA